MHPVLSVAVLGRRVQGESLLQHQVLEAPDRDVLIIDTRVGEDPLRSLIGAPIAPEAALLFLDAGADEHDETRSRLSLLRLLGVRQIIVATDSMHGTHVVQGHLELFGLRPLAVISASRRDVLQGRALLDALQRVVARGRPDAQPLRLLVQATDIAGDPRVLEGCILSGGLSAGDKIVFSPSGKAGQVAMVERCCADSPKPGDEPSTGKQVRVTLKDPVFVERGAIVSHLGAMPKLTHAFDAEILWLGPGELKPGDGLTLEFLGRRAGVRVQEVMSVFDRSSALTVRPGEMATVSLRCAEPLALDDYADVPETGRFVLAAGHDVIGGGIIDARRYPDERIHAKPVSENITPVGHKITPTERARRYGHRGAVIWLTGLSGSGKSTLSMELERQLFQAGCAAYVLDGDNVRRGLNTNLGFSPEDRKENIRRVGEVAALFADAGLVCITAFISPYREDRAIARSAVKTGAFYEIHVRADLATCERRDPKGLYSKARRGELKGMTGIDAPYEPPESPDLVVDTATESVEQSVAQLLQFVQSRIREFSSAAL